MLFFFFAPGYLNVLHSQLPFMSFVQEEKIAALQSFADQLISADHYAKGVVANRRNEVLDRLVPFAWFPRGMG